MNKVYIIGLGPSDINNISIKSLMYMKKNIPIFLRTKDHPIVKDLKEENINFKTFDEYYLDTVSFDDVYEKIVGTLVKEVKKNDIIYAVPGHPLVAEYSVELLINALEDQVEIIDGKSFIDACLNVLKIDLLDNFNIIDALNFNIDNLNVNNNLLIGQIYDQMSASNTKIILLDIYPPEHEIKILKNITAENEEIITCQLFELDHHITEVNNLITVYVPPIK